MRIDRPAGPWQVRPSTGGAAAPRAGHGHGCHEVTPPPLYHCPNSQLQGMARRSMAAPALLLLGAALALCSPLAGAAAAPLAAAEASAVDAANIAAQARAVPEGGSLTITDLALEGGPRAATLELQEVRPWAPGATVVVQRGAAVLERQPSDTRFFSGALAGSGASTALLSVHSDGGVEGLVQLGRKTWGLGTAASTAAEQLAASPASNSSLTREPFSCNVVPNNASTAAFQAWRAARGARQDGGRRLRQVRLHVSDAAPASRGAPLPLAAASSMSTSRLLQLRPRLALQMSLASAPHC